MSSLPDDPSRPPRGSARALRLAAFLPYRLSVTAAAVSDGLARIYGARFGIGIPEWRVLATVGEFGSITATAIGLHAHMGKVKVSRAAAALEGRGLIRRSPNPDDLREAFLLLTEAGDRMYGEIAPLARAYVHELTADLSDEERRTLDGLLDRLLRRSRAGGTESP